MAVGDSVGGIKMDYRFIRYWGQLLGSFAHYIDDEVERARADKALQTAIYQKHGYNDRVRGWVTLEDITSPNTLSDLARLAERAGQREDALKCRLLREKLLENAKLNG
jgi:hypothetical protein